MARSRRRDGRGPQRASPRSVEATGIVDATAIAVAAAVRRPAVALWWSPALLGGGGGDPPRHESGGSAVLRLSRAAEKRRGSWSRDGRHRISGLSSLCTRNGACASPFGLKMRYSSSSASGSSSDWGWRSRTSCKTHIQPVKHSAETN